MKQVIVVGAGLAGLACALDLRRGGCQVRILEAEDEAGGRLRTTVTADGYRLDRGFQVLLAGYPALRRRLPLTALQPRYFASSLQVINDGRRRVVGHPAYAASAIRATVTSGLVAPADVPALARVVLPGLAYGDAPLISDRASSRQLLLRSGVSANLREHVIRPFFAGISLDPSLGSDAAFLRFVLRSMAVGRVFVPALGIAELPRAMSAALPPAEVQYGCRVERIMQENGRATGVVANGRDYAADVVVVATEAPEAATLSGLATLPRGAQGCVTAYFASDRPLYHKPQLALNAGEGLVNHIAQITNIAPAYAPPGKHLLAAVALGDHADGNDAALQAAMLADIRRWYPGAESYSADPIGLVRVPYSQFAQPPGVYRRLPASRTGMPGLYLAGEFLHSSSVQGALRGGELAAQAILHDLGRR